MWEVFSYGGGDYLRIVFNGIASVFGQQDYTYLMRISAIIGTVVAVATFALQGKAISLNWLVGIVLVIGILIGPKKTIIITDVVVPANSSVVANIPIGLAAPVTVFSKLGDWAAKSFEVIFSMPVGMSYRNNGLLFANNIIDAVNNHEISDPRLAQNFNEFYKSCVAYDLLFNLYTWSDVLGSNDLDGFFKANTSVTRSFSNLDTTGTPSILNCRTGYVQNLSVDLANEIDTSNTVLSQRLIKNETSAQAQLTKFLAVVPNAYDLMTSTSMTQAQYMSQAMIGNVLSRGITNFASEAGADALANEYAVVRAEKERRVTYHAIAAIAKKILPIMKGLFESFIYAIFPIILLAMLMPGAGRVILTYAKAVLWVNLWAPLYALLHFAVTYHSQKDATSAMANSAGGVVTTGYNMMSNTALAQVMNDTSALAGYLAISIPLIAWMLVSASGAVMAGLASRVTAGYEKPISGAAGEAGAGNYNLGNTNFDNHNANKLSNAPRMETGGTREMDAAGRGMRVDGDGRTYYDSPVSSAPVSLNMADAAERTAQQNVSRATSSVSESRAGLATATVASSQALDSFSEEMGTSSTVRAGTMTESGRTLDNKLSNLVSSQEQFMENNNINVTKSSGAGWTQLMKFSANADNIKAAGMSEAYNNDQSIQSATTEATKAASNYSMNEQSGISDSTRFSLESSSQQSTSATNAYTQSLSSMESAQAQLNYTQSNRAQFNTEALDAVLDRMPPGTSNSEVQGMLSASPDGVGAKMTAAVNSFVRDKMNERTSAGSLSTSQLDSDRFSDANGSMADIRLRGESAIGATTGAGISSTDQVNRENLGGLYNATPHESNAEYKNRFDTEHAGMAANVPQVTPNTMMLPSPSQAGINSRGDDLRDNYINESEKDIADRAGDFATATPGVIKGTAQSAGEQFGRAYLYITGRGAGKDDK